MPQSPENNEEQPFSFPRMERFLRWTERYTKTDMVYLFTTGWWINLNLVIVTLLSLLLSIAFANLLPAATYGLYQYLISLSGLVAAVALSGMASAVAQASARGFDGSLRSAVRAQLRFAILPAFVSFAGATYYFIAGNLTVGFGLVSIALFVPLTNAFSTYSPFLEGKRKFKQEFFLSAFVTITYYSAIFLTLFFFKNALVLVIVNLGINAIALATAYRITRARYVENTTTDPETVRYGAHLSVLSAFGLVLTQLDSVLVFHFLGPVELAVYSFATLIPERGGSFFNFIGSALLPKFANSTVSEIQKGIRAKLFQTISIGVLASAAYALLAPFLFHHLFPRYGNAIIFTQVYAPVIALLILTRITTTALFAKRFTREIYVIGFLQPLLLVILQIPLLLLYGIMGMIIAKLATDLIGILLGLFFIFFPLTKQEPELAVEVVHEEA